MAPKKVFVSGCYDLLHSGHVEFFRQAAEYGDLYVGIGSDKTIEGYKHHRPGQDLQDRTRRRHPPRLRGLPDQPDEGGKIISNLEL